MRVLWALVACIMQADFLVSEHILNMTRDQMLAVGVGIEAGDASAVAHELRHCVEAFMAGKAQASESIVEAAAGMKAYLTTVAIPKLSAVGIVEDKRLYPLVDRLDYPKSRSSIWDTSLQGILDAVDLLDHEPRSYAASLPEFREFLKHRKSSPPDLNPDGQTPYLSIVINFSKKVQYLLSSHPLMDNDGHRRIHGNIPMVLNKAVRFVAISSFGKHIFQTHCLAKVVEAIGKFLASAKLD